MKATKVYQEIILEPDGGAINRQNILCATIDQNEIILSTGTGDKGWFNEGSITWDELLSIMRSRA